MSEHTEQCALIRWFDLRYKAHKGRLYAVPNAGNRKIQYAMKMKAEGLRPGVPDLCLPCPSGKYHGLYIELKTKKGRPSESQLDWIDYLRVQGYMAEVCYGWEAAKDIIEEYLNEAQQ